MLCVRFLDEENLDRVCNGVVLVDEDVVDFLDLWYFYEVEQWELWFEKNGGVLDDIDLDFFLFMDFEEFDVILLVLDVVESINLEVMLNSLMKLKGQNIWMKFVDVQLCGLNDLLEVIKY